ncbi:hypothetical protein COX73_03175 [bacterium (Candidatus Gribaldobacteria) CG_4_10_14_0_2_um_filter_36_18]|uniref:Uncharacterized protein n=1 Tax=bacterium (Candidatus Gribaldobacteria) CG_4_10_14_0_2_um_filter_36_18 TaxID=2014264 RepID=A0A2M7VJG0_9BACT|nr:MAG: hypothetical protein COX73_03175 [bacterium (Candidatus Gribaldobacteria) CG_4_10_14_0_2_um_filter_36_18]
MDLSLKKIRYRIIYTMKKLSNKIIFSALLLFLLMPLFIQADVEFEPLTKYKSIQELIDAIAKWVYWTALALAPLMIIIGAFYLITASGDPDRVNTGRKIITWTIVGIAVVLLAASLIPVIKEILGAKK